MISLFINMSIIPTATSVEDNESNCRSLVVPYNVVSSTFSNVESDISKAHLVLPDSLQHAPPSVIEDGKVSDDDMNSLDSIGGIEPDVYRALLRRLLQLDGALDEFYLVVRKRWEYHVRARYRYAADIDLPEHAVMILELESAEEIVECILADMETEACSYDDYGNDSAMKEEQHIHHTISDATEEDAVYVPLDKIDFEGSEYEDAASCTPLSLLTPAATHNHHCRPLELSLRSIPNKVLRDYLGYASTPCRARLLTVLYDRSLRTSTQLSLWRCTEMQMTCPQKIPPGDVDAAVFASLFSSKKGQKTLISIGGFSAADSLLPNSLSIGRLRCRSMSWNRFATNGGRMPRRVRLADHRRKKGMRGNNGVKEYNLKNPDGRKKRQRGFIEHDSASEAIVPVTSLFQAFHQRIRTVSDLDILSLKDSTTAVATVANKSSLACARDRRYDFSGMSDLPDIVELTISRRPKEPWSITLTAEEGGICVVHERNEGPATGVKTGDIVLAAIGGCTGMMEATSITPAGKDQLYQDKMEEKKAFERMIEVFRTNDMVYLIVKRVTSAMCG